MVFMYLGNKIPSHERSQSPEWGEASPRRRFYEFSSGLALLFQHLAREWECPSREGTPERALRAPSRDTECTG